MVQKLLCEMNKLIATNRQRPPRLLLIAHPICATNLKTKNQYVIVVFFTIGFVDYPI